MMQNHGDKIKISSFVSGYDKEDDSFFAVLNFKDEKDYRKFIESLF